MDSSPEHPSGVLSEESNGNPRLEVLLPSLSLDHSMSNTVLEAPSTDDDEFYINGENGGNLLEQGITPKRTTLARAHSLTITSSAPTGEGAEVNGYTNDTPKANVESPMMDEAWDMLKKSYVFYKGVPVGTVAASDPSAEALNYNQVFFSIQRRFLRFINTIVIFLIFSFKILFSQYILLLFSDFCSVVSFSVLNILDIVFHL